MRDGDDRHYSYRVYARRETAEGFDADRFGGPVGRMVLERQERVLRRFLAEPIDGRPVLDAGTGTGRAALVLASLGGRVLACDASQEMLEIAREKAAAAGAPIRFQRADIQALPFPDGAFETVVAFRVLLHVPDWRAAVAELCRVARRRVIVDVPPRSSFALLEPPLRRLLVRLGRRDAQTYRVFPLGDVEAALERGGFRVEACAREFVLPLFVYRRLGSRRLAESVEGLLAAAGLRRWWGGPATITARRDGREAR